jgi:large subunit ribosomal protein L21
MQAVIKIGSTQYLVKPDQTIEIDLVNGDAKTLEFQPMLVIDGDKVTVGTPLVDGVTVVAEVVGEVKADKIKVLKFKAKKRVSKLTGHRQRYTQVRIASIGSAKAAPKAEKAAAPKRAPRATATAAK